MMPYLWTQPYHFWSFAKPSIIILLFSSLSVRKLLKKHGPYCSARIKICNMYLKNLGSREISVEKNLSKKTYRDKILFLSLTKVNSH